VHGDLQEARIYPEENHEPRMPDGEEEESSPAPAPARMENLSDIEDMSLASLDDLLKEFGDTLEKEFGSTSGNARV
jgi:hypothetical protein